jgi:hypothetical protein
LHDDVRAFDADVRLRHTETVDTVLQDVDDLVELGGAHAACRSAHLGAALLERAVDDREATAEVETEHRLPSGRQHSGECSETHQQREQHARQ